MFLWFIIILGLLGPIQAATNVGGVLLNNAVWTSSGSANPYYLTSDVQIPRNVTLTIRSGVKLNFTQGDFEIFIKGVIIIQGTSAQPVVFEGGSASDLKWMLHFQSTPLSNSSISYAQFQGPKQTVLLDDTGPNLQQNTGTLLVQSSTFSNDAKIQANSNSPNNNDPSAPTIQLLSCSLTQATVIHSAGGPFRIIQSTLLSSTFHPQSADQSLQILDSTVRNLTVIYDAIRGSFGLINSNVINATVISVNGFVSTTFTILQSVVHNISFSYSGFFGSFLSNLIFQNSTIFNVSISTSPRPWFNPYSISIQNCTLHLGQVILYDVSAYAISIKDSVLTNVNISTFDQNNLVSYSNNNCGTLTISNTNFTNGALSTNTLTANVFYSTITLVQPPFSMTGNSLILCTSISRSGLISQSNTLGLNAAGLQMQKSTIKDFAIGLQISPPDINTAAISETNFLSLSNITIYDKGAYDVMATYNYWGTSNLGVINKKIVDYWDNIYYGEVIYSGYSLNVLPAESGCAPNEGWDVSTQTTVAPSFVTTFSPLG